MFAIGAPFQTPSCVGLLRDASWLDPSHACSQVSAEVAAAVLLLVAIDTLPGFISADRAAGGGVIEGVGNLALSNGCTDAVL